MNKKMNEKTYIKNDLADLKKEIIEAKKKKRAARTSGDMSQYHYEVFKLKQEFRMKHVAYCLLRGKDYLQVENKVREGNELTKGMLNLALLGYPDLHFSEVSGTQLEGLRKW